MSIFPAINIFFIFLSLWVALSPRFRSDDVRRNWSVFSVNMFAVVINIFAVVAHLFK